MRLDAGKLKQGKGRQRSELLLNGEHIIYHSDDLYITDRRIIKHREQPWAKALHYFYESYEDLDLRFLESIKAKNVINLRLLITGTIILLLGPIVALVSLIPGIGPLGSIVQRLIVEPLGLGGSILIGAILIISAIILRDRVIEFHGQGSVLRALHFDDEELVKIRDIQRARMRRLGMDR